VDHRPIDAVLSLLLPTFLLVRNDAGIIPVPDVDLALVEQRPEVIGVEGRITLVAVRFLFVFPLSSSSCSCSSSSS